VTEQTKTTNSLDSSLGTNDECFVIRIGVVTEVAKQVLSTVTSNNRYSTGTVPVLYLLLLLVTTACISSTVRLYVDQQQIYLRSF